MDTKALEKFAQAARRQLHDQVAAKLALVLNGDSGELRGRADALRQLKQEIRQSSQDAVVERVAYTWFNRFCALRYMDVNGYTRVPVVSPYPNATQPAILQEAKAGQIDDDLRPLIDCDQVMGLLQGQITSHDPQQEAYRLLLVAVCNHYHAVMPFLFEPIADYTELLMPDDLLSASSVLHAMRAALTSAACEDVEVIGWLYQFYISEKKEAVDAKVKKGGSVEADELPAKTSLYTPHWIVRFLVENSLGRLWLLNRPHSKLADRMDYYIAPEQPESDFVRVDSPEELRICDPACGSGHMLTYAFDLLYAIYEEEGYSAVEIPRLILEKNLVGMEIDERSGALAAFALVMKGRARDRRFLRRGVKPAICVYKPLHFSEAEVKAAPWLPTLADNLIDLPLADALLADLQRMPDIGLVGSLLRPQLTLDQIETLRARIGAAEDLFSQGFNDRVRAALDQLVYLAQRYHVVVANPPYLGKGMGAELKEFAERNYPNSKADCFAMFIERNLELAVSNGLVGMITMQSWMFLSSYEKLRATLLDQETILVMAHLGTQAFDTIGGAVVSTTAFVLNNAPHADFKGDYFRLVDGRSEAEKESALRASIPTPGQPLPADFYRASAADFKKIPGTPIAYWVSERLRNTFQANKSISDHFPVNPGIRTGKDEVFLRLWFEVATNHTQFHLTDSSQMHWNNRWFPLHKGGNYRKWYGNGEHVIDLYQDGSTIKTKSPDFRLREKTWYFKPFVSWSRVSSSDIAFRHFERGVLFSDAGPGIFAEDECVEVLALLNSKLGNYFLEILNPTLNYQKQDIEKVPFIRLRQGQEVRAMLAIEKHDWDSYETSWDFSDLPLLRGEFRQPTLAATYAALRGHWQAMTQEMQRLEEENNRIFIEAYGLQGELTPDVPLAEITLTCNPHYRYGGNRSEAELEALLRADTMREFISYAVGCLFGRYSLDKPGLILANQGETLEDYLRQVPNPTFPPDKDNVIPILDGDWFPDDIVARFRRFLRVTFGEAHFGENLAFIERALGRDLRSYFVREFYNDHVKRYQKARVFIQRWKDSVRHRQAFATISHQCAQFLDIEHDLARREIHVLADLDLFELVDQKVLSDLVRQVANRTIGPNACTEIVRRRRQGFWYERYADAYTAVEAAAHFLGLVSQITLEMQSLADGIAQYCRTWYQLDQLYRHFIYRLRRSGQMTLFQSLYEQVENHYTNSYLLPLNNRWQEWIDAADQWEVPGVMAQQAFFAEQVQPFLDKGNKVSVVISDALRYEAGEELLRRIRQEDRFEATLQPGLAMLPSFTQLGMAALLPHKQLTFAEDDPTTVLVDGLSSKGTENRRKILAQALDGRATAIQASDLLALGRDESRALIRDHDVVYVYHNRIDAIGDRRDSEEQVFDAAADALDELVRVVKKLANANASNVVLTADHGFLYQHRALEESDFAGQEASGVQIALHDRRFVIGRGLDRVAGFKHFSSAAVGLGDGAELLFPKSINRLRVKGSGSRYVHGGVTLQEVVIPVLQINKKRQSDVRPVEVDILRGGSEVISTGQLSVAFYQVEPVDEKVQPIRLRAGIYTQAGVLISDTHDLTFDLTADQPRERERRVQFVLTKNADAANGQEVELRLEERVPDTTHYRLYKSTTYRLRRSFTADFEL